MLALGGLAVSIVTGVAQDFLAGGGGGGEATGVCPGQPSSEIMRDMLNSLSTSQRAELNRLWAAIGDGRERSHPIYLSGGMIAVDPAWFAWSCWGGSDCKITSAAGRALNGYVLSMLNKQGQNFVQPPLGGAAATGGIVQTTETAVVQAVQAGVQAVGGSLGGSIASQVNTRTDYTLLPDWLPWAMGGVAVVALVMLARR